MRKHSKIGSKTYATAAPPLGVEGKARTPSAHGRKAPSVRDVVTRRQPLAALYMADTVERVEQVRAGVPAELIQVMLEDMGMQRERLYTALRLPRATVNRKLQGKQTLSPDESERVLGVARLVGQVQTMVRQSGEPEGFDAARWLAEWLGQPNPALGHKQPAEFLDTADGRMLVSDLLSRMSSGAYS